MRPDKIEERIKILDGVELSIDGNMIKVKGEKGNLERAMAYPNVQVRKDEDSVIITSKKPTKREKRMLFTMASHIKNMMSGVKEGYVYKLKLCSGHFPATLKLEKDKIVISNFLGEKIPRRAKVCQNVDVKIEGDNITVSGIDKELVGQTCSSLELATRIKKRDRRVFQSGIFITEKAGKPIR